MKILFAGKERYLKFNIYGIEKMQDKSEDKSVIASFYATIWGGLEGYRYANGEEKDYTFSDVIDFVDALTSDERKALNTEAEAALTESQAFKSLVVKPEGEQDVEDEKKNQPESNDMNT